jgi:hypothetical protein
LCSEPGPAARRSLIVSEPGVNRGLSVELSHLKILQFDQPSSAPE